MNLLEDLKNRLKIMHSSEDDELQRILKASERTIQAMTGASDMTEPILEELIIERSRYAYNDSLEYFEDNFQSQIMLASYMFGGLNDEKTSV